MRAVKEWLENVWKVIEKLSVQENNKKSEELILQTNLTSLRTIAGLSIQSFADMLGISRQGLYKIEEGSVKLSRMNYIAIRSTLEAVAKDTNNEILAKVLVALFEAKEINDENHDKDISESVAAIAAACATGVSYSTVLLIASSIMPVFGALPLGIVSTITAAKWLKDLWKKK